MLRRRAFLLPVVMILLATGVPVSAQERLTSLVDPFVGTGGWPSDELELPHDLGARLPQGVPVHVFHGLQDETAPPSHADLYARAIPLSQMHRLRGRDHQLGNDLSEVATTIKEGLGP